MKIVIVGGGSSYTPELISGLIEQHAALPVSEVCLHDINPLRLEILTGLTRRMLRRAALPVTVTCTTELAQALPGASFVNCLVRIGGMPARIQDEQIPLKHGIIGQETTGPGGMMKALRTIPPVLELAHTMAALCPQAWLINYTNPSGILAEALGKHSRVRFVGLCSGPAGWISAILERMQVAPQRAQVDWIGLNHLGFAVRVWVDGQDATAAAVEAVADHWGFDPAWLRTLGMIPCSYLRYYYHHPTLVQQARQPGRLGRGQQVQAIEAELLRQYADPTLDTKPALLAQRGGGGYAEVALAAMRAIHHNCGERQYIQTLNRGAVEDLPTDASVEIACLVDSSGPHPLHFGALPLEIRGLVQAVKAYESLTVAAAVAGDRRLALQALVAHPLVGSYDTAAPLLDELLQANRDWLPWV
jgi:6-phospho-beta-glucosidase